MYVRRGRSAQLLVADRVGRRESPSLLTGWTNASPVQQFPRSRSRALTGWRQTTCAPRRPISSGDRTYRHLRHGEPRWAAEPDFFGVFGRWNCWTSNDFPPRRRPWDRFPNPPREPVLSCGARFQRARHDGIVPHFHDTPVYIPPWSNFNPRKAAVPEFWQPLKLLVPAYQVEGTTPTEDILRKTFPVT